MASSFDPASPVPITADDIAWFRNCRAAWEDGESGAPGIVPNGQDVTAYLSEAGDAAAGRLEPILLAIFLNARFEPGLYRLDPPVRATDGWQPGASLPGTVLVRPEHIALLQGSSWVRSFMDDKRPFGSLQYFEADMAILLGRRPPVAADGAYQLSPADERMYQQMHRDMLLVLQAYIQHAALEPGQYALPRDGWTRLAIRGAAACRRSSLPVTEHSAPPTRCPPRARRSTRRSLNRSPTPSSPRAPCSH